LSKTADRIVTVWRLQVVQCSSDKLGICVQSAYYALCTHREMSSLSLHNAAQLIGLLDAPAYW